MSAEAALPQVSPFDAFGDGIDLVSVFDTTVCDDNLGNHIIMEAVDRHLRGLFPSAFFIRLPYLDSLGAEAINYARRSRRVFLGGTNALSSEMETYRQWGLDAQIAARLRDVVLMGVGWWQYQGEVSAYTRDILTSVLHPSAPHSVRDTYTGDKLRAIGFDNVIMTGCPSLWDVDEAVCAAIPRHKADNVLLTLTYYSQHPSDAHLVEVLRRHYRRIFLWVQGPEDYAYARRLGGGFEVIAPSLAALDQVLEAPLDLDVVGTRLHAGIRALGRRRRTVIVGVDNRALEMGRDLGLPVLPRDRLDALETMIRTPADTRVRVPAAAIAEWKRAMAVTPTP